MTTEPRLRLTVKCVLGFPQALIAAVCSSAPDFPQILLLFLLSITPSVLHLHINHGVSSYVFPIFPDYSLYPHVPCDMRFGGLFANQPQSKSALPSPICSRSITPSCWQV